MQNILAIDDKPEYLEPLAGLLNRHNFAVDTLTNPFQALQQFQSKQYHCVLLDVKMPGKSGLEVLDELLRENPTVPVIMISGESTIPIAVKAVKTGAFDFVEKNGSFQNILDAIEKAMARLQQLGISDDASTCQIPGIIGNSPVIQSLCRRIRHVTMTNVRVLITGESGTGKELVAHAIHKLSGRARKPFVTINCAAIPRDLFESELFGHRKGSFTGAVKDQLGKFLEADGGTIFLDEIGEMDMALQAKLLRVLQEGEIEPIGGGRPQPVDVRVLAASNRDLEAAVAEGNFREDLYYRL
ncbi:MAG: sigma-54-dependent Fis family transcriptional regulator, partial [Calditrichaeota bacterium]|nr:sigma-54-dependent Fis family transcriptional regulator [Calditrichota bacterium]